MKKSTGRKSARKATPRARRVEPVESAAPEESLTATAAELEDALFQIYPADIARVVLAAEASLHRGKKETLTYPAAIARVEKHLTGEAANVNPGDSRRQQAADGLFVAVVNALAPFVA